MGHSISDLHVSPEAAGHRPFDGYGRTVDGRIPVRLLPRITDGDGTVTVRPLTVGT